MSSSIRYDRIIVKAKPFVINLCPTIEEEEPEEEEKPQQEETYTCKDPVPFHASKEINSRKTQMMTVEEMTECGLDTSYLRGDVRTPSCLSNPIDRFKDDYKETLEYIFQQIICLFPTADWKISEKALYDKFAKSMYKSTIA
jgi:hypothetical protein